MMVVSGVEVGNVVFTFFESNLRLMRDQTMERVLLHVRCAYHRLVCRYPLEDAQLANDFEVF